MDQEYMLFNIAEGRGKKCLHLPDILYVKTDETDPRHKQVYLGSNERYTLMNYSLDELLKLCPQLFQVNKSELISWKAIKNVEYDIITLNNFVQNDRAMQITLSRRYKKGIKVLSV